MSAHAARTATARMTCYAERGGAFPSSIRIFANGGYQGPKMAKTVAATTCWKIVIVKRSDVHRFVILPKRWIVERTLAWISRTDASHATSNVTQQPSQPSSASP